MRPAKNAIERRLDEVKDSRAEVRAEIKRLERALKNPERLMERSHLLPTMSGVAPRIRTTMAPSSATTALPGEAGPLPAASAAPDVHPPVSRDERFARYFSSTRFFGPPTLGRERNVQRWRALWVSLFALLMLYIALSLIFH